MKSTKEIWSERIKEWQQTNMTGIDWCRKNSISYHAFGYWKRKLLLGTIPRRKKPSFVELPANIAQSNSTITIIMKKVKIELSNDFDSTALLRCLKTLKSL